LLLLLLLLVLLLLLFISCHRITVGEAAQAESLISFTLPRLLSLSLSLSLSLCVCVCVCVCVCERERVRERLCFHLCWCVIYNRPLGCSVSLTNKQKI
jgi:hypothetical protein